MIFSKKRNLHRISLTYKINISTNESKTHPLVEQPPPFVHSNKFIHKIERTVVLKSPILRKNYQQKTGIASHWEKKKKKNVYIAAMKLETRSIIAV